MYKGKTGRIIGAAALPVLLLLAGCNRGPERRPAIGQAFVGPATLKIRKDIPLESGTAATLKHGDRVEIIGRRRRFMLVRNAAGVEGWTHERQLLSTDDMRDLETLSERAAELPVQGQASTFEALNVHTLPNRQAPSFEQIKEKQKVDVLAHVEMPRKDWVRQPLLPPPPKKAKAAPKPAKEPKYPPPPIPQPPPPPANWLELSKTDLTAEDAAEKAEEAEEKPDAPPDPGPMDRWTLVRLPDGQAGWALTRRLFMAIPDEVAQYAEGRRIVAYFPLGEIQDEDQKKTIWLWATASRDSQPYDYESFRVFIWSLRRHRYETAYIARNLKGYLPILMENVEISSGSGAKAKEASTRYPGFSVCVEKSDGRRYRQSFALLTNVVRFAGERPCETTVEPWDPQAAAPHQAAGTPAAPPSEPPAESLTQKIRRNWQALRRRWFHR